MWFEFLTNLDAKGTKRSVVKITSKFHNFFSMKYFVHNASFDTKQLVVKVSAEIGFWAIYRFNQNKLSGL